ncbi:unnamed protein product [Effrenium voratum]|nr:unnamed protein product [Effrenium voratum]
MAIKAQPSLHQGLQSGRCHQGVEHGGYQKSQLAGQKRVALLFLLSAPPGTAELLLKHTSEFGSQSAFAEDGNRAKLSKEALQEAAHLCQLLQAVQDDLAEQGVAATSLSEKLLAGDRNLEMELQVALAERSASWTSAGLTVVKELMKGHAASAEGKFRTESEKRSIVAGELEREEFSLMLKMFEHDIKAYANWLLKCEDHEASVYHAELQHKLARQQEAFRQAKACFQESSREWMATLACHGSPQDGVARIDGILRHLSQTFQVAKDSICVVALLNWSAPSLVSSENQRTQAALAGYLVNSHSPETGACIGLLLSPAHSYHRGLLWKQEESANKLLANSRLNMDMPFVLPYMDRADERDQRSMIRHGRLMLSMEEKPHSKAWQFWRSSALLSKGLLDAAEVVSGKDLVAVEDISDDALPSTTSLTHTQGAAEKVAQVGVDGCTSILRGALSSLTGAPKPVVLVVDLNAHTGDLGRAVVKENFLQSMGGMNLFYLGLHATQSEVDWALQHHTEKLAEQLSNGNFKPFISLPERNAELVAAQPPPPNLSLLAYSKTRLPGSTLQTLSTPAKVLAAWHDHSIFKGEFREFLQKTRADYPLDLPPKTRSSENEDDGKSKKRKINVPGALPSGSKTDGDGDKAAIAEEDFFEPSNLNPLNHEAHLVGSGNLSAVMLVVTVGEGAYLQNTHAEPITIRKGTTLAGYYKGKFWAPTGKEKEEIGPADVLFSLEGSQDYIILGGKYMSLLDTIKTKRSLSPSDAHVGYHTLTDSPSATEPAAFTLSPKQAQVYFKASDFPAKVGKTEGAEAGQDDVAKIPAAHMAGTLPASKWNGKYIKMCWAMKWPPVAAKGLQPIRPMVVNSVSLTIPPGKALQIVKPDS